MKMDGKQIYSWLKDPTTRIQLVHEYGVALWWKYEDPSLIDTLRKPHLTAAELRRLFPKVCSAIFGFEKVWQKRLPLPPCEFICKAPWMDEAAALYMHHAAQAARNKGRKNK